MTRKRLLIILGIVSGILLIPLVSMVFTKEVDWSIGDFLIGFLLLSAFAFTIDFVIRKLRKSKYRIPIVIGIFALLILTWAELAVGIFGTPLAGN